MIAMIHSIVQLLILAIYYPNLEKKLAYMENKEKLIGHSSYICEAHSTMKMYFDLGLV